MDHKILATESIDEFIDALIEMRGLVPLNKHLLHLLFEIKNDISLHTQKFLTLCMSLLDDGNTRVPLDSQHFSAMWTRKWNGLVMLRISTAEEDIDENAFATASDFASIITGGIQDILTNDFSATAMPTRLSPAAPNTPRFRSAWPVSPMRRPFPGPPTPSTPPFRSTRTGRAS